MIKYIDSNLTEVKKGKTGTGLLIEHDGHIIGNKDVISQIYEDIKNHKEFVIPDRFIVSAIFQKYGIKNANGRIYTEHVLKPAVERYIKERVNNHCAIGALDHPSSSSLSGHDVSLNILNLEWEGKTLIGEMELHLTPGYKRYGICSTSGDLLANLILDNILVGVSSRAVGSVEEKYGDLYVSDDLDIISFDSVLEPSTNSAFIKMNRSELQPFIETNLTNTYGTLLDEKINRISKILF